MATVVGIMTQIAIDRILHTGPGGMPHRNEDGSGAEYVRSRGGGYLRAWQRSFPERFSGNIERQPNSAYFMFSADGTELTGMGFALPNLRTSALLWNGTGKRPSSAI